MRLRPSTERSSPSTARWPLSASLLPRFSLSSLGVSQPPGQCSIGRARAAAGPPPVECAIIPASPASRRGTTVMALSKKINVGVLLLARACLGSGVASGQAAKPGVKGYQVEWVYRVKYGYIDE